ncbi:GAF domain-containing SpoIIE family protein phosphatase [Cellulomonas sp. PhB143]|uniref:GAF domain-containing SpoIIE family protein phosphatase n=1 Tax=Cellulomonas sp. PhB143 TaxID=2485186 RepID=UPI000F47402B|nr:GAF domain-containing SpoIIE family protein phosphatase [Cellulomonas sp. PhB143]ROS75527.1 PAS domain S-box-containing protein [Cellulomonas sp. PhB143]
MHPACPPADATRDRPTASAALPAELHLRSTVRSDLSFAISDASLPDNPVVWVNEAFERTTGYLAADVVGRNCRFLQADDVDRAAVQRISAAVAAGRPVAETVLNVRKDGTRFWNQLVVAPVRDDDGRITHHVGIQADVSERVLDEQAREREHALAERQNTRLSLLASITQALVELFDERQGAALLPELVAPHFGDWCLVAVLDERGAVARIHVAAADAAKAGAALALEQSTRWLRESPMINHVVAVGNDYLPAPFHNDLADIPSRVEPLELEALRTLGLGTSIVVPLRGRDRPFGVLTIVSGKTHQAFTRDDVADITAVGARSGLALDNARLYAREHSRAVTLQRSMLPELTPVPGLDCAAAYVPATARADVGGDWYDVIPLEDGTVGLAVGDVVGHDIEAAASMGQLRSVLRSRAWSGASPLEVLDGLDQLVRGLGMADIATCAYLRVSPAAAGEPAARTVTYARAGHLPPLLLAPDGTVTLLDEALTTPIGITNLHAPTEAAVRLEPGATLVLYTDGLVERRDRGQREGLAELVAAAGALPRGADASAIRDLLVGAMTGRSLEDDLCVLVVRHTA